MEYKVFLNISKLYFIGWSFVCFNPCSLIEHGLASILSYDRFYYYLIKYATDTKQHTEK